MTAATVYINTDNVSGTEDGTTLATGYVSLSQAVTSETTALTQNMTMKCSGATADTSPADTGGMDLNGFSLTIEANRDESDGFYDGDLLYSTSHYRLEPSSGFQMLQLDTAANQNDDHIVDGIQMAVRNASFAHGIQALGGADVWIRNCRIKHGGSANGACIDLLISVGSGHDIDVYNNIIFGADNATNGRGIWLEYDSFFNGDVWITNNTIFECHDGIFFDDVNNNSSSSTLTVKNNAIANCTDDYNPDASAAFTPTVTHNATDDGDGTSSQDLSPGTPESDEWPDHWTDPNNATVNSKDFTAVAGGALDGNGTTGTGIPTTDILGETRDGSTPTIGAFELITAGQTVDLAGSVSPTGALLLGVQAGLAGSVSPSGALAQEPQVGLAGSVSPTGSLSSLKLALLAVAGAVSPSGAITLEAQVGLAGSVTPTGDIAQEVQLGLDGNITPTGAVELIKASLLSIAGAISPTGTLSLETQKALTGSVSTTGILAQEAQRSLIGSISPSGALAVIKTILVALAGAVSPSGSLTRQAQKSLAGSVSPSGDVTKEPRFTVTGSISPVGALSTLTLALVSLAGSISPGGALSRQAQTAIAGSLGTTGTLANLVSKALDGAMGSTGTLLKRAAVALGGTITPAGTIATEVNVVFPEVVRITGGAVARSSVTGGAVARSSVTGGAVARSTITDGAVQR